MGGKRGSTVCQWKGTGMLEVTIMSYTQMLNYNAVYLKPKHYLKSMLLQQEKLTNKLLDH